MTDELIEQIKEENEALKEAVSNAYLRGAFDERRKRRPDMEARILADAEVIKAAEVHLVKRLKALQTYFDLSDEELESMTSDERADTIRQHRLISEALAAFRQAQARAALEEKNDDE